MKTFKLYIFTLICILISAYNVQANTIINDNGNGNGNDGQTATVVADCFSLFPNPASTHVNVRLDEDLAESEDVITILILDSSGKIVEEMILERYEPIGEFDLGDFPAGDYIVKLMVGDECCQMKRLLVGE